MTDAVIDRDGYLTVHDIWIKDGRIVVDLDKANGCYNFRILKVNDEVVYDFENQLSCAHVALRDALIEVFGLPDKPKTEVDEDYGISTVLGILRKPIRPGPGMG